jgi:hypothetical protein
MLFLMLFLMVMLMVMLMRLRIRTQGDINGCCQVPMTFRRVKGDIEVHQNGYTGRHKGSSG